MGRLIDADSFKNFIESLPKNPNGTSRVYDEASILRFIDAQPTAYDVEKVVGRLEKERICLEDNYGDEVICIGAHDAISIVRKGGVE